MVLVCRRNKSKRFLFEGLNNECIFWMSRLVEGCLGEFYGVFMNRYIYRYIQEKIKLGKFDLESGYHQYWELFRKKAILAHSIFAKEKRYKCCYGLGNRGYIKKAA